MNTRLTGLYILFIFKTITVGFILLLCNIILLLSFFCFCFLFFSSSVAVFRGRKCRQCPLVATGDMDYILIEKVLKNLSLQKCVWLPEKYSILAGYYSSTLLIP